MKNVQENLFRPFFVYVTGRWKRFRSYIYSSRVDLSMMKDLFLCFGCLRHGHTLQT